MNGTAPFGYSFPAGGDLTEPPDRRLLHGDEETELDRFWDRHRPDTFSLQASLQMSDEDTTGPEVFSLEPPPTVIDVSTIDDLNPLALSSAFYNGNGFPSGFFANTQTSVPPASIFYNNAQAGLPTSGPYATSGSLGMTSSMMATAPRPALAPGGLPTSDSYVTSGSMGMTSSMMATAPLPALAGGIGNRLAVQTHHGAIPEPLAAMLPLHSERGSVDAQLAAHFSQIPYTAAGLVSPRAALTRSYTYGTDTRFNQSGYTPVTQGAEAFVVNRLIGDTTNAFRPYDENPVQLANGSGAPIKFETAVESVDGSDENEAHGPAPRRRKTSTAKNVTFERPAARRTSSPTSAGVRKRPLPQDSKQPRKKKAPASAVQRQNLTDQQKRENHIKSEQKRRNVIQGGFTKIMSLTPACLNGNFNKSTTLMEAAKFLTELHQSNKELGHYLRGKRERGHA